MRTSFSFLIFAVSIACISAKPAVDKEIKYPVVLVPGDGGSQFEGRLHKPKVVHIWCAKDANEWFPMWLNLESLAPFALDCFVDNMRLTYDRKKRITENMPGVETRQPGFGDTDSVEWLDASHFHATTYFYQIAMSLINDLGYVRNKTIKGAPYDFRKAPNEMKKFFVDLKNLVQDTYKENDKKKVVLIGHSMGNTNILYFLNKQSQAWKDKYIAKFISLAGPYGGAAKTMRLMASGDNLGAFVVNPLSARPQQRSMPSTAWLLPYDTYWNESEVIIYGPNKNYTTRDYKQFFEDINYMDGYYMREDTEPLLKDAKAPMVEVHCLHGVGVDTPHKFKYTIKTWYDDQPDVVFGPGDGTVNLRSLHGCLRWVGKNGEHTVSHTEIPGAEHLAILAHKDAISYITKQLK